jgi:uncharacterized protein (TIGR00661 family)
MKFGEQKKYLLSVQGEGRGHMTQAMVIYDILRYHNHNIQALLIATSSSRSVPDYFLNHLKIPVYEITSPNFKTDANSKKINWIKTIWCNAVNVPEYIKQYYKVKSIVSQYKPDIIINFYDVLTGLYLRLNTRQKAVAIAHQYIYLHPKFNFPKGFHFDRLMVKLFTALTAPHRVKKLALSFYDITHKHKNIVIVPPLLRHDVFELQPQHHNFYLVYLVNAGYFDEILTWHNHHQDVIIHCFTDASEVLKSKYSFNSQTLHLHNLCDKTFLKLMSQASGIASTAGFESICEAMYLGKPVLMVPVKGHFEQFCNSRDAHYAGAGAFSNAFNLSVLQQISNTFNAPNETYRNWVNIGKQIVYNELCR